MMTATSTATAQHTCWTHGQYWAPDTATVRAELRSARARVDESWHAFETASDYAEMIDSQYQAAVDAAINEMETAHGNDR
jgi:hypothetical protein